MKIDKSNIFKICLIIGFFSYVIFKIYQGDKDLLNMAFSGRIQSIIMTEKSTPKVTVGNRAYLLRSDKNFMQKVKIGDSIIKKKDERHITVISKKNKHAITLKF